MATPTPETDLDSFARHHQAGATVLDVREPGEYVEGHVPGALPLPMGQLPGRLGELDVSEPVFVLSASGARSSAMTDVLTAAGFEAYSVAGGTQGWAETGRQLVTGRDPGTPT
jgi:rhodanese-related sulfurtransferase